MGKYAALEISNPLKLITPVDELAVAERGGPFLAIEGNSEEFREDALRGADRATALSLQLKQRRGNLYIYKKKRMHMRSAAHNAGRNAPHLIVEQDSLVLDLHLLDQRCCALKVLPALQVLDRAPINGSLAFEFGLRWPIVARRKRRIETPTEHRSVQQKREASLQ